MYTRSPIDINIEFRRTIITFFSCYLLFTLSVTPLPAEYSQDLDRLKTSLLIEQIFLEQGLSQSIIQCIMQDRRGFLWFATEDGLNQYDGYRFYILKHNTSDTNSLSYNNITAVCADRHDIFWIGTFFSGLNRYDLRTGKITIFRHIPSKTQSLIHDNINCIYEDRAGAIWVGTDGGLNKIMPEEQQKPEPVFIRFQHDPDDPGSLSHNTVHAINQDPHGSIWIGTDSGLNRFIPDPDGRSGHFSLYQHDPRRAASLSNNTVRCLYVDRSGSMWVGTERGLNVFKPDAGQIDIPHFITYLNNPADPASLSQNAIYAIFEDRDSLLWIGTNGGGVNIFDRISQKFIHFLRNPNTSGSLSYNEIRSIYEDRSGLIWIGTYGGGVNKVSKTKKKFLTYRNDIRNPNSLNQNIVWSIYQDKAGILWIGTHGGGLNRFDRKQNRWSFYQHVPYDPSSLSHNIVRVIYPDPSGIFWIGTHGGGLNKFNPESGKFQSYQNDPADPASLSHNAIRSIYKDRSGVLWIGTYGGGLNKLVPGKGTGARPTFIHYRYDPVDSTSLSNDIVRAIHEDSRGQLWIGTEGGGLNKFDREKGTFKRYRSDPTILHSLSNDYIFSIHEDRSGTLWFCTFGGGINKYNYESDTFIPYTIRDGLPDDAIYGILEDDQGFLWLSSNKGLCRFDPVNKTCRNFSMEDGLQSSEFNGGSYFRSPSGEMFFGGINGLNSFYPGQIRDNPFIPPVVITSIQKLNQQVDLGKPVPDIKELALSYQDYIFSIEFSALDFTAPSRNQYAYRMEGLDKDWIPTTARKRSVTYTTLPPGRYTFRVKASNNDGIWNETGSSLKITITPPWWQNWWFRTTVVLFIAGLVYTGFRRRLRTVKMKTELQTAHLAQMSIMPRSSPLVPGFEIAGVCLPANEVGGDFYDYFWLNQEKTKIAIALGDVSGKGMKAAMIAVLTDGMLNSTAGEFLSTSEIMSRINRQIYSKLDRSMFTALLLVSINTNSRVMTFTNAGLNKPLLKTNSQVQCLESGQPGHPLGMMKSFSYVENQVRLIRGDILLLITDGIVEAQNSRKELYSEDKLIRLFSTMETSLSSAEHIKDKIIQDVRIFSGSAAQFDDMALVVIKVT